jgi:hypothetical protein
VVDLTKLSPQEMENEMQKNVLTYGSTGSDRTCGYSTGQLKKIGIDPSNTGAMLALVNGQSIHQNESTKQVHSGAVNNFLLEANRINGLFAFIVDLEKIINDCVPSELARFPLLTMMKSCFDSP